MREKSARIGENARASRRVPVHDGRVTRKRLHRATGDRPAPFWTTKTLAEMTDAEWESLCDGCGRCCLQKLEDEDTGRVHLTVVACALLDVRTCRCSNYAERARYVPECVRLRPDNVASLVLPTTCAYRCLAEGRPLPAFHPLLTGDPRTVHTAGASVRGWAISGRDVPDEDLEDYVVALSEGDDRGS